MCTTPHKSLFRNSPTLLRHCSDIASDLPLHYNSCEMLQSSISSLDTSLIRPLVNTSLIRPLVNTSLIRPPSCITHWFLHSYLGNIEEPPWRLAQRPLLEVHRERHVESSLGTWEVSLGEWAVIVLVRSLSLLFYHFCTKSFYVFILFLLVRFSIFIFTMLQNVLFLYRIKIILSLSSDFLSGSIFPDRHWAPFNSATSPSMVYPHHSISSRGWMAYSDELFTLYHNIPMYYLYIYGKSYSFICAYTFSHRNWFISTCIYTTKTCRRFVRPGIATSKCRIVMESSTCCRDERERKFALHGRTEISYDIKMYNEKVIYFPGE